MPCSACGKPPWNLTPRLVPSARCSLSDRRFRQALNLAVDRHEIIESVYYGMAAPPTTVPGHHDPAAAKALLDDMGMDQRDAEGYRLAPNGEAFELYIEIAVMQSDFPAVTELLVDYFEGLGIRTSMNIVSGELRSQRANANELMATIMWFASPMWEEGARHDYLPGANWSPEWQRWYVSDGETGEQPPDWMKQLYNTHERILRAVPHTDEDKEAFAALYGFFYEYVPAIIPVEDVAEALLVSKDLGNVPFSGQAAGVNYSAEQFFFRR